MPAPVYRPEIDGLRAVAIVPVVLFHASVPGFGGGFVGVDVFFVISGYLITGILARDLADGGIRFAHFYERRARRIVPALLAVLAVCAVAAWSVMTAEDFRHFGRSLGATALFAPNVWYALRSNYFNTPASAQPLLHTWSLGVEEQFYLLFPLLLALCWRLGRRFALAAVATLLATSFAGGLWLVGRHPEWAFFLPPTRLWELMAGALCALVPPLARRASAAAWTGLALLTAGFLLIDRHTPDPGPLMLLPVGGTMLILLAGRSNPFARVLGIAPLVGLGLISYGTYLWHVPLLAFARYTWFGPLPALAIAALIGTSVVLGWLSYRFIEGPIRRRAVLKRRHAVFGFSLIGLALFAALGTAIATERLGPRGAAFERSVEGRFAGDDIDQVVIPPGTGALPFVIYGDSHARQYYRAFSERFGSGALVSGDACLSLPGISDIPLDDPDPAQCRMLIDRFTQLVEHRPVRVVVFAHLWDRMLWDAAGTLDGDLPSEGARSRFEAGLEQAIARIPAETRIVIIGHVPGARPASAPAMKDGWLRCRTYLDAACPTEIERADDEGNAVNRVLAEFAARHPRVVFLDPADVLCGPRICPIFSNGKLVYSDETHVALSAGRRIAARVASLAFAPPRP